MLYNKEDLKKALQDDIVYIDENYNYTIDNFVLDNRELTTNSLFIAKKGAKTDGHNFIASTLANNDSVIIIAEYLPEGVKQNSRIILVKDSVKAMEKLATYSRNRLKGKVIGITGSVGKSSSKEIYKKCLSNIGKSHCNIRSFNNYTGVLATLINTPEDTEYAVFEMGVSEVNEMDTLRKFVKPNICVILEIFANHIGNFNNELEIVEEKAKISDSDTDIIALKKDSKWFAKLFDDAKSKNIKNILEFGDTSNIYIKEHKIIKGEAHITYSVFNKDYVVVSSNLDYNMAYNMLPLIAFSNFLNLDIAKILEGFEDYETFKGRNNIIKVKDFTIIDGSYNANVKSFISGLNLINNIVETGQRKVCIFGDILELGNHAKEIHLELVEPVIDSNIDVFIGVGENMKFVVEELKKTNIELHYFNNVEELLPVYKDLIKKFDLIFIKASNGLHFSKIIEDIQK